MCTSDLFHERMIEALEETDQPELAPLVGEFHEVGKDRIPAQAADVLGWHARRAHTHTLDRDGERRYWRMIIGGDGIKGRYGYRGPLSRDLLQTLANGFARRLAEADAQANAASSGDVA